MNKWKKFMAVGCNHGSWADPTAIAGVLKFKSRWKPDLRIHLGDYMDTTSFRSGAGIKDHIEDIKDDLLKGVEFLTQFEPTLLFNGNHDIRVWESLDDSNAHRRFAAQEIIEKIRKSISKKTEFVEDYNITTSIRTVGDTNFLHGFMYNDNGVRDHAAHFGKCVIAHLHKVTVAPASRMDSPVGYCVGYLGNEAKFEYATRRRAISQWTHGFAWGEYSDKECIIHLNQRTKEGEWRFPV
jgi:predicted phosphodiesterase